MDGDGGRFTDAQVAVQDEAESIATAERAKLTAPHPYEGDVSGLIEPAIVNLLFRFVEGELYNPDNIQVDWEWDLSARRARIAIDEAYIFFKRDLPVMRQRLEELQVGAYRLRAPKVDDRHRLSATTEDRAALRAADAMYKESFALDAKIDRLVTKHLCRIIVHRGTLWT